jgi:uncharacterized surface protein with fasciclin (FAS1) repeats
MKALHFSTSALLAALLVLPITNAGDRRQPATQPAATPPPAAAQATSGDILEVANSAGQFTTLLAAVQAAGLVDILKGPGPFTVFAPTDAAFAALPNGTVADLLKPENRAQLTAILTYHVVPGRIASSDLSGKKQTVETVQGTSVEIDGTNGVTVDGAKVVAADVAASNGIIHVIDKVLTP